jgi:hypothetical protein
VILALDLGKFNNVLCRYEPDTRKAEFRTVRSSAAELRTELALQTDVVPQAPDRPASSMEPSPEIFTTHRNGSTRPAGPDWR